MLPIATTGVYGYSVSVLLGWPSYSPGHPLLVVFPPFALPGLFAFVHPCRGFSVLLPGTRVCTSGCSEFLPCPGSSLLEPPVLWLVTLPPWALGQFELAVPTAAEV